MSKDTKTKTQPDPDSFVAIRRQVKSDVLNKKLTRNEFMLLIWLFLISNIYGIVTANLSSLREDLFPDIQVDSVSKLLRSLRDKKYLYYENHRGRGGSFELHLDHWLIKKGHWKLIGRMFETDVIRQPNLPQTEPRSEPNPNSNSQSRKFLEEKAQLSSGLGMASRTVQVGSVYTEKEKETETENIDVRSKGKESSTYKSKTLVRDFVPTNAEEFRCLGVAQELPEEYMDYLLSVLEKHGIEIIERAYGIYKEQARTSKIDNPSAYFNRIVQTLVEERNANR